MKTQYILISMFAIIFGIIFIPSAQAQYISVPGVSSHGQGAGVAVWDLDDNGKPDMILMAYHNSKGTNSFRYKVGKDLASDGTATSWTSQYIEVEGVGRQGDGAGATIGDINANGTPDLIFMAYDSSQKANKFCYKIGWDLNENGIASSWSGVVKVEGVGHLGEGAGAALGDIDRNGRPELVLMAYDSPEGQNSFRYKIGWNLNPGAIATEWTAAEIITGVSDEAEGAGVGVTDIDGDEIPEIVLMSYDKKKGNNTFHYKIGRKLSSSAKAEDWEIVEAPGMGESAEGADIAFWDMLGNGKPELILMAYDHTKGGNTFRYRITGIE